MKALSRAFYDRDALTVAPELLNKVFVSERGGERVSARIVEVEAYAGHDDPGAHSYRGETPRNAVMFGPPGHLYVYFSYGVHWCMNAVCGPGRDPHAVLLRAADPVDGIEIMRSRRKARRDRDLLAGPGRLTQAFAITGTDNGVDLTPARAEIRIVDDGTEPPDEPGVSTRIGLAAGKGEQSPWRYTVPGSQFLSRAR